MIGVTEIDGGTLYNTLLYLGPDGRLLQRHRKLMPTGGERTVWGMGDGSELGVVSTPFGVVGGLLCWENYMPLARAAIYAQHCDIYLAPTWDNSDTWVATLRHIAKEGRQFVIGVAPLLRGSDVPEDLRGTLYGLDDDWMSRGHTTIVAPGGEVLAGPVLGAEEIVYADLDVAAVHEQHGGCSTPWATTRGPTSSRCTSTPAPRVRSSSTDRAETERADGWPGPARAAPAPAQRRSNRSRFMTLSHAATKSRTNFSFASSLRVDLRDGSELGVRAEDEVDGGGRPLDLAGGAVPALVDVLRRRGRLPLRAHVEQVHEEVVGQRPRAGR